MITMKKILFLFLFLSTKLFFSQILVNESFEGTALPTGWAVGQYDFPYYFNTAAGDPCHGSKTLTFRVGGYHGTGSRRLTYSSNQSNGKDIFYSFKYSNKKVPGSLMHHSAQLLLRYSINNGISWIELQRVINPAAEVNCATVSGKIPGINVPVGSNFVLEVWFSLSNNSSGTITDVGVDDVKIEQKPNNFNCYMPVNITTPNITNNSVKINWANQNSSIPDNYEYFISTNNLTPEDSTLPTGSTPGSNTSITLNTLQPDTQYYLWMRSSCGTNEKSFWTNVHTFKTECNPVASVFEDFSSSISSNFPNCWDCVAVNNGACNISGNNTNKYALLYAYYSSSRVVALPPLNNINSGLNRIRFKSWKMNDIATPLYVGYITDLSNISTFVSLQSFTINENSYASAIDRTVNIPNNLPANSRLAFKTTNESGYFNDGVAIDDVAWEPIPMCSAPTALSISDYSLNSLTLNWSPGSIGSADSYEVYYTTGTVAPIASTVPTISGIVGNSVTLTNLVPNNVYRVWVRASCSQGGKSDWSSSYVSSAPCVPDVIRGGRVFEYFNTTGGIYNLNYTTNLNAVYNNQSSSVLTVAKGTTFNYTGKTVTIFGHSYYMWIDWNRDAQFDNVTEKIFAQPGYPIINGSYFIDPSRPSGVYKMRIATSWYDSNLTPCSFTGATTVSYIDFTLEIVDPPVCIQPKNLMASNMTGSSVDLSWEGTSSGGTYDIFYSVNNIQPSQNTVPTIQGVMGNSTVISNLPSFSKYYVWIRENCGNGNYSYWSVPVSFETLCLPPVLTASGGTSCAGGKVTLNALCGGNCSVRWYDSAVGGTLLHTGNSYLTNNLTTSTTYYAQASYAKELPPIKPLYNSTTSVAVENSGGLVFSCNEFFTLKSVDVFVANINTINNLNVTIQLLNQNGQIIYTKSFPLVGSIGTPQRNTLELNWDIPPGMDYQIIKINPTTGTTPIFVFDESPSFPVSIGNVGAITRSIFYYNRYDYFYNWKVLTYCNSQRQGVLADIDSTCLGVNDTEIKKADIQIYPNPFENDIQIDSKEKIDLIIISDLSGRQVKNIKNPDFTLHLNDLASGVYLLTVKLKTGDMKTFKILKK